MPASIACFLGAGFSYVAGVPLAKDLLRPRWLIAMSDRSGERFRIVQEDYENWQQHNPGAYPEQYMGLVYENKAGLHAPRWNWLVEYVCAVIASAGTPPGSLNRNPRYSNRVNVPFHCGAHQSFWSSLFRVSDDVSVITTNYDILVERVVRHRQMQRPPSPGCFYGGIARPQKLTGAAQPFSRWAPARTIEMSGSIPVFKLHGALNWSLNNGSMVMYQDLRPVFRHGGTAAIIPPIPEKLVPPWLQSTWRSAEESLRQSNVWIVCGYSLPHYDAEVLRLLEKAGARRSLNIFLMSPEADALRPRWATLLPDATVTAVPGLPEGTEPLGRYLALL
jgi:hypothetical protein